MAHLFKKKRDEEEMNIDLTPMLDVVFIMLIFFIVTATFVQEQGFLVNRPPPSPEQETPPDPSKQNAVFVVSETDEIWLGDRRIDVRAVRANVERIRAENPEAAVVVRAHELASADIYIGIMDQATEAIGANAAVSLVTYAD
ncbi:MAG: ExbD/TolR family protein [Porticoccaceae bacterium]